MTSIVHAQERWRVRRSHTSLGVEEPKSLVESGGVVVRGSGAVAWPEFNVGSDYGHQNEYDH